MIIRYHFDQIIKTITTMASMKITVAQLLLCVIFALTGINGKPPSAIVGGTKAGDNEFPYMVGLLTYGYHTCGGAIIDSTHILTAAHCIDGTGMNMIQNMVIVSGTNNIHKGNQHRVKSVKVHPQYAPKDTWKNDIAIITLRDPIKLNDREKAVKLPTKDIQSNVMATASGWGDLSYPNGIIPEELQKLDMTVIAANKQCKLPKVVLHDGQVCAYAKLGTGLCDGDSGGPLVSDGVIVGISSYVFRCAKGKPDVFTRVYKYLDWIKKEIKN